MNKKIRGTMISVAALSLIVLAFQPVTFSSVATESEVEAQILEYGILDGILDQITDVIDGLMGAIIVMLSAIAPLGENLIDLIMPAIELLWGVLEPILALILTKGVVNLLGGIIQGLLSVVTPILQTLIEGLLDALEAIPIFGSYLISWTGILLVGGLVTMIAVLMGIMMPLLQLMLTSPAMGPIVVNMLLNPLEAMAYGMFEPILLKTIGKTVENKDADWIADGFEFESITMTWEADVQLIDVRTPAEYAVYRVPGAVSVPFQYVPDLVEDGEWNGVVLDDDVPIVFICKSGFRAFFSGILALNYGYTDVINLLGGTDGGWISSGYPVEK